MRHDTFSATGMRAEQSPFHAGEQRVQEKLGVRDIEHWARKVVRDHLPQEYGAFFTSLPFLIVAARDAHGRPWATLLTGEDGFVTSPGPRSLVIGAKPARGDALENALFPGADLGVLGIEFAMRRRNRVNGRISGDAGGAVVLSVDQSFGNCPQYIRERQWRRTAPPLAEARWRGSCLTAAQQRWIASADTLFIASGYRGAGEDAAFGMDASHRGGNRGFVRVLSDTCLTIPDYAGNNHYNTIGNLILDQRSGLLFVDFQTGSLLQLTGRASIEWESESAAEISGGRRLIVFQVEEVVERRAAIPLCWDADADSLRSLRLIDKIRESDDVTSFVFAARDGGPLPVFKAGQHLPLELRVPGFTEPVRRTYSLSCPPATNSYRISVKRHSRGIASRHLHDFIESGAILDARNPAGEFVIPAGDYYPVALVSAGVGLTPLVSMLHALADQERGRPVWFIHGARDGHHHPLAEEVRQLAAKRPGIRIHIAYSRPRAEDEIGVDYDTKGRIDAALLSGLIKNMDARWFVCGPVRFMAEVRSALEDQGVSPEHIRAESFGPAG